MGDLGKQRDTESTVCTCRGMVYITKARDHKYVEKAIHIVLLVSILSRKNACTNMNVKVFTLILELN